MDKGKRQHRHKVRLLLRLSLDPDVDAPLLEALGNTPRGRRATLVHAWLRRTYLHELTAGCERQGREWVQLLSTIRWLWRGRRKPPAPQQAAAPSGKHGEGASLVLKLHPSRDRFLISWLEGIPRRRRADAVRSVLRHALRDRFLEDAESEVSAHTGEKRMQRRTAEGEMNKPAWLQARPLEASDTLPSGPSYPWNRGGRGQLWCVQHTGNVDEDAVPYPVWVHSEDLHAGQPCSGPGHSGQGFCRHEWARSPIAAVARALGVGDVQVRQWWENGWIAVNGKVAVADVVPPSAGLLRVPGKDWEPVMGAAPAVPARLSSMGALQWCVRGKTHKLTTRAVGPVAQVHACQDHAGEECPPPAPWLPQRHLHRHVRAVGPFRALVVALGVPRATAQRWIYDPSMVCLEGPTALWFRERRQRQRGERGSNMLS